MKKLKHNLMQGHNTQLINVEIKQFYFQSYTVHCQNKYYNLNHSMLHLMGILLITNGN